jgi:hypothetical protein
VLRKKKCLWVRVVERWKNCRPQQNPLQIVGLSKKGERSEMRRKSSSQTWNNKSTVKWQVRADIKMGERKWKLGCQKQA